MVPAAPVGCDVRFAKQQTDIVVSRHQPAIHRVDEVNRVSPAQAIQDGIRVPSCLVRIEQDVELFR